jgi:hypothetical protein
MKTKSLISYFPLIAMIFILTCCQKEHVQVTTSESSGSSIPKSVGCPDYYRVLNPLNPIFLWCKVWGCNCIEAVIIKGATQEYEYFLEVVESGSEEEVADFFSQSNYSVWSSLFPGLEADTSFLTKLQSGDYKIGKNTVDASNLIFLVHTADTSDYFGMPVRLQ